MALRTAQKEMAVSLFVKAFGVEKLCTYFCKSR